MTRPRVLMVMGTRPEAIKLSPVHRRLTEDGALDVILVSTGQHRELLADAAELFGRVPDHDLRLLREGQSLGALLSGIVRGAETVIASERPDLVLVQGDTTSALGGALAAASAQVPIGHVEAGLRTHEPSEPFPEEMNRRQIAVLARLHFAPTRRAVANLRREGVDRCHIFLTGNTVVDALDWAYSRLDRKDVNAEEAVPLRSGRLLLVTMHRRESWDDGVQSVCAAIREIATEHPDVHVVFPVHPNPKLRDRVERLLGGVTAVSLVPPLPYLTFLECLSRATCVLTDSGGVQEEAPSLGIPVIVLRRTTERPEGVDAGSSVLVGLEPRRIVTAVRDRLSRPVSYPLRGQWDGGTTILRRSPYGDGRAAPRIASHVYSFLGLSTPSGPESLLVHAGVGAGHGRGVDDLSEDHQEEHDHEHV